MQTDVRAEGQTDAIGQLAEHRAGSPRRHNEAWRRDGCVPRAQTGPPRRRRRHPLGRHRDRARRAGPRAPPDRGAGAEQGLAEAPISPRHDRLDHPRRRAAAARRWSSSRGHAQPRSAHGLELAGAGVPPHRAGSGRGRGCVPRSPACPEPRSTAQVRGSPGLERRSGARSVSSDPRGTSCAGAAAALSARQTPGIVRLPTPTSRHLVDPSVYGKRVPERDLPRSTGARQRRTCPAQHARPPRVHEHD